MKKYIEAISALNNATLSNPNKDDIERCTESEIYWTNYITFAYDINVNKFFVS